jgi:hypothetical protein
VLATRWSSETCGPLVGIAVVTAILFWSPKALATASTCGSYGPYHQGKKFDVSVELDAIQADVEARSPGLCNGSTVNQKFSGQSPMVYRDSLEGWAQIGVWHNDSLCCFRYFWQWKRDAGSATHTGTWGLPTTGSIYNFKVIRFDSDGHLHMLWGDPDKVPPSNQDGFDPETTFDPHVEWDFQRAEAFSEVTYVGNDIAGTDSNRASFRNIQVQSIAGGWRTPNSWANMDNDFPCFFHTDGITAPDDFVTWTDPISHGTSCP